MSRLVTKFLLEVTLPLLFGLLLYVFGRKSDIMLYRWLGFGHVMFMDISHLPKWLVNNLPDSLWIIGFTRGIILIWKDAINKHSILWYASPLTISIGLEYAQLYGFINGTYDSLDIVFYLLGFAFALSLSFKQLARSLMPHSM